MIDPRDRDLARIYREAEAPEPPQRIDDAILAASRRVAGSRPRRMGRELVRRSSAPLALAATVLLTFTLALMVYEDFPEPELTQTPKPQAADTRSDKLAESPPAESKLAATAEAKSEQLAEFRSDTGSPRTAEKLLSGERASASEPPLVRDIPSAPQEKRESEPTRASRPMQPAPSAPAPSASSRREMTSTPQGAGVVAAPASRLAADEAKERSPEKWLEDIRILKSQGKTPEAERELAAFRKRYPDYRLPEDLR